MKNIIVLAVCMLTIAATANASRILVLVPTIEKTNWESMQMFIEELIFKRGHYITCITCYHAKHNIRSHRNYTENGLKPIYETESEAMHKDISWFHKEYSSLWISGAVAAHSAAHGLNNKRVRGIMRSTDLHFDLIINDEYYHESWLLFGTKFKAPIITIAASSKLNQVLDYNMGFITPFSHVSHSILGYDENMSFFERWMNTWFSLAALLYHDQFHLSLQNQVARDNFFAFIYPTPTVRRLIKNVSLTLVNSHAMLWPARPAMPTLINIGGAHLRKPKPLPKDIQTFIDGALDGIVVVYFERTFDVSEMQIFLDAFAVLGQRVFWHHKNSSILNKVPSNVLFYTKAPRYDILADPNVVLYISNTDHFESIYNAVPMLMLPLNGEQKLLTNRIHDLGCGLGYNIDALSVDNLKDSFKELLLKEKYTKKAIEMSVILKKHMVHPMDKAMYWIEYVIRHRGAKHLKSYGVNMAFYRYFQWDLFMPIACFILFGLINLSIAAYLRSWTLPFYD